MLQFKSFSEIIPRGFYHFQFQFSGGGGDFIIRNYYYKDYQRNILKKRGEGGKFDDTF
jgi:hypothetical protein